MRLSHAVDWVVIKVATSYPPTQHCAEIFKRSHRPNRRTTSGNGIEHAGCVTTMELCQRDIADDRDDVALKAPFELVAGA